MMTGEEERKGWTRMGPCWYRVSYREHLELGLPRLTDLRHRKMQFNNRERERESERSGIEFSVKIKRNVEKINALKQGSSTGG